MKILLHAEFRKEEAMGLAEVGIVDLVYTGLEEGSVDFPGLAQGEAGPQDLQDSWLVV